MAINKNAPKLVYFIPQSAPTEEDIAAAEEIGGNIVFRNTEFINNDEAPEPFDGVAGATRTVETKDAKGKVIESQEVSCIPEVYKDYPSAEEVMKKHKAGKFNRTNNANAPAVPTPPAGGVAPGWNAGK